MVILAGPLWQVDSNDSKKMSLDGYMQTAVRTFCLTQKCWEKKITTYRQCVQLVESLVPYRGFINHFTPAASLRTLLTLVTT